jgi:hypothetical protein
VRGVGFVMVLTSGRDRESRKKNRGINPFFPYLCVCRGRRRTVSFKTTLFQVFILVKEMNMRITQNRL